MIVLPSGETSSETQVPSSVVNSIVRFDLSGSGGDFFVGSSFFCLSFGSFLSLSFSVPFSCADAAMTSSRGAPMSDPAATVKTRRNQVLGAARRDNRFMMQNPFGWDDFEIQKVWQREGNKQPASILGLDERLH